MCILVCVLNLNVKYGRRVITRIINVCSAFLANAFLRSTYYMVSFKDRLKNSAIRDRYGFRES